ncbi:CGNR zinc finger domain-containing protein [Arthrobacter sp. 2MCAF14]|uniref:CGNR zinc finger domain-containing protein n=1 Tax=Arthrobacter sp. 2MCAF14 TaxID=3232982 RepID=UPI003F8FF950
MRLSIRISRNANGVWERGLEAPAKNAFSILVAAIVSALMVMVLDAPLTCIKTCGARACMRVFFDSTKNQSRRYCARRGCAARTHSANFRQRKGQKNP